MHTVWSDIDIRTKKHFRRPQGLFQCRDDDHTRLPEYNRQEKSAPSESKLAMPKMQASSLSRLRLYLTQASWWKHPGLRDRYDSSTSYKWMRAASRFTRCRSDSPKEVIFLVWEVWSSYASVPSYKVTQTRSFRSIHWRFKTALWNARVLKRDDDRLRGIINESVDTSSSNAKQFGPESRAYPVWNRHDKPTRRKIPCIT
jgi:hypothetical protein